MRRQIASTGEFVEDKQSAPSKTVATSIRVKVYSPFKVFFDEEAESVSAENGTGPFDVLAQHHNFLTLLKPCELIIRSPRQEQKIRIDRGVMHVKNNQVTVFLDV